MHDLWATNENEREIFWLDLALIRRDMLVIWRLTACFQNEMIYADGF